MIAGGTENALVLHGPVAAMRYKPRIGAFPGAARARGWDDFMRTRIPGLASSAPVRTQPAIRFFLSE